MGEHGTWFDYLNRFSWWHDANASLKHLLGRPGDAPIIGMSAWSLTHVLVTILVLMFVVWGSLAFFRGTHTADKGLVPPRKMNLRNFFEYVAESVYGMVEGALGKDNAARFFPLIGALFLFILFGNLIGLIPGFISPDDTLKTNVGLALFVFVLTHFYGFKEHGIGYLKHFLGPSIWLAPLMLPIELVSHLARPLSLSMRLMGNMLADHKVVFAFFALIPLVVPLPFMLLGLLVCFIQALVFCTLTMVYLSMAVSHAEH